MMNSPPRYTRTVPEGSFYEHHNKHIDAANVNFNFNFNGSSAPPPAYSREANQTSTATQDAQVNVAEDGSSSSSQWAALERTPSIPQQVEPTPSRPQHAEPIPSRLQQVEATPSRPQQARLSDSAQRTVKFVRVEVSERRTVPRYGHGAHGYADNNDALDGRPVRPLRNPKYRFCLNRRFTYALMSVMVLIIMAYAIAKGVTFFNREKGKEEDGGSLKSPLLASQSSGGA